ncbi:Heparinase II/III-like protein [compost metagenome]
MTSQSSARAKLQELAERAEELLKTRGAFYTDGAKLALTDMLEQAKLALEGKGEPPFARNREFYAPREEEAIEFATLRYTMVPPFARQGAPYTEYGLEPALQWFERQDVLLEGPAALPPKAAFVLDKALELLKEAAAFQAQGIGEYSAEARERLTEAAEALRHGLDGFNPGGDGEELARLIVSVFNQLRELRHSRLLRTDLDPEASLYLTQEGLEEVRAAIASSELIREQYEHIVRLTETYTLKELQRTVSWIMKEEAGYNLLNRHYYLWSSTDKIANFKVPESAVTASLSFILPSVENEQEGLGHVWIDNVEILTASGGSLAIDNGGFEEGDGEPAHWRPQTLAGSPVFKWESEYPFCGGGETGTAPINLSSQVSPRKDDGLPKRSLYLCNPTPEDEGAWSYGKTFRVESGTGCTLTFAAKLDGKLKQGLKALITYMDEAGKQIGTFEYLFNRKSSLPGGRLLLPMQCDAIQYALTGERKYAVKVKLAILYILHDFAQGAEHWLVTNLRPEGSDAYGAVQGGRLLSSIAVSYSLIRTAGTFNISEKQHFYALVEYMLHYMLDLRDRTEWSPYEAQRGCSNWQTDMCAGTGMIMMALPDFPNRRTWLNNANMILKSQLELNVNPDGSWPESIRYHHAALERFAGYAKVLKNVTGEDWFHTTPLARMFSFGVDMQTPGYEYFDGRIGTPPFGDHALGGGQEFGYFPGFLQEVAENDQELASRMYHTWVAAGRPFKKLWGESIILENITAKVDNYTPNQSLVLGSTADYPDAGITIFRKNFSSTSQSYFAIMSSPKPIAHGHLDQGSFVLYKNSVPLIMDSGIEGYFDSSTSWHISSYSHACVQFATRVKGIVQDSGGVINLSAGTYSLERGWVDVPKTSKVLDVRLGAETETITIEIANPEGGGRHIRHVTYIKQPDLYIIRDRVLEFEGKVLFSLPIASKCSEINGCRVYSKGAYNINLETIFMTPIESLTIDQGRSTQFYERNMMDYVRAIADAEQGFLTVLYPHQSTDACLMHREEDGVISLDAAGHLIRLELNRSVDSNTSDLLVTKLN